MIRFDIISAYHFVDIYLPHTNYLGFALDDGKGTLTHCKSLVLPFELLSARYIYTKLIRLVIVKWRSEAIKVIMFLDDEFVTEHAYNNSKNISLEIKSDSVLSGLVPKVGKSCWEPMHELQWVGVLYTRLYN